jgi:hypothetical protein
MLDVEKFLISLRNHKAPDGRLDPIHLADTVQEEIKIIQAAVENSRRKWVGLTLNEAEDFYEKYTDRAELINAIDKFLEEKNA